MIPGRHISRCISGLLSVRGEFAQWRIPGLIPSFFTCSHAKQNRSNCFFVYSMSSASSESPTEKWVHIPPSFRTFVSSIILAKNGASSGRQPIRPIPVSTARWTGKFFLPSLRQETAIPVIYSSSKASGVRLFWTKSSISSGEQRLRTRIGQVIPASRSWIPSLMAATAK